MRLETHIKVFKQKHIKFDEILDQVNKDVKLIKDELRVINQELQCILNLIVSSNVHILSPEKGQEAVFTPFYDLYFDTYQEDYCLAEAARDELVVKLEQRLKDTFSVELQGQDLY